uniref:filamentous haemagglutinin family protein n=1 Tax=Bradyrhizobium sp. (strain ORS 278) TaxID=114615 RepID=UPI0009FEFE5A|nr:filamentous haemagglutinin family protein [Bradyrhizobium sp. ORS 278]
MFDHAVPPRRSRIGRLGPIFLSGVSVLVLTLLDAGADAASLKSLSSAVAPTDAAQQAAITAAQQAAAASAQAQTSLARASAALAGMRKLQQDAAAAARGSSTVPNGLTPNGLMPYGGTKDDPLAGIKLDPGKWVGANGPTQTTTGSQTTIDIQQTQQKALLYWDSFNVGANTTVNFRQASADWIAFNRVASMVAPSSLLASRIDGNINAKGAVYVINSNGIIFGAGSQVNVHTLIASSLDIGPLGKSLGDRDDYFKNTGIANLNSFSFYDPGSGGDKLSTAVAGDVVVERGAKITANSAPELRTSTTDKQADAANAVSALGKVFLFGANVTNSGAIEAPTGQVAMVSARTVDLVPNGFSVLSKNVLGTESTTGAALPFRGIEFSVTPFSSKYNSSSGYPESSYLTGTGVVTHDGLISAPGGIVMMTGNSVVVDNPRDGAGNALTDGAGRAIQGVLSADTALDFNSFVMLRAATNVTLNGIISSLPYDDGASPLPQGGAAGSSVQAFKPAYVEMTAQTAVTVGSSGLISAPSAEVALRAVNFATADRLTTTGIDYRQFSPGIASADTTSSTPSLPRTILLAPGAVVDVAGLSNVTLPASYNFIRFAPRAEFADMPLQRDGILYGKDLVIDIRDKGTRSDGTSWVGTPVADASGYVANVGRSIYQSMTAGGKVSLQTDLGGQAGLVQTAGSVINVSGGSVKFEAGWVPATRLLGADGRIYSMAKADPNMTYVGIFGQFTVNHARWGITETWSLGTQSYSPGYTDGQTAGSVTVSTAIPQLQGTIYFGSTAGERQIANADFPYQGALTLTTPSTVQIGATASANYVTASAYTTLLSPETLSGYGLSKLSITANDLVVSRGSTLNLAPGGSFTVAAGGAIDISGTVSAAGGSIDLSTDRPSAATSTSFGAFFKSPTDKAGTAISANIYVEGSLDVSGRFVNDSGGGNRTGAAYIDGGSISIRTSLASKGVTQVDKTGSIILAPGSLLDVSSGGYVSAQGRPKQASSGTLAGKAGSIALSTYLGTWNSISDPKEPLQPTSGTLGTIQLDGSLRGYGFERNGSLSLSSIDTIRIGGALQAGEISGLKIGGVASTLPVELLTNGGFGSYTIASVTDGWTGPANTGATAQVIVSAGVGLTLQQRNLDSAADYTGVATGTKLGQGTPALTLLPGDQRQATNLTLRADNILLDSGSTVIADAKANVTLGNINYKQRYTDSKDVSTFSTPPAKTVELRGAIVSHGGNVFVNALNTHLSSGAQIDVSGSFVANSYFGQVSGPLTSGSYIRGGSFEVEAGELKLTTLGTATAGNQYDIWAYAAPSGANYLVSDVGAQVDVSGAAGSVQVRGARGTTAPSVWSWSDAGTVKVDVTGYAWGGSFTAVGGRFVGTDGQLRGETRANNGTVVLGGGAIVLAQDAGETLAALGRFNAGGAPAALYTSVDQLTGFDNVYLYAGAGQGGAARVFTDWSGTTNLYGYSKPSYSQLSISSNLNWNVANRLHIAAGQITTNGTFDTRLVASYVELTGGDGTTAKGANTLTISANTIDVEGAAFSGFGLVNLMSSGDMRLSTPKVVNGVPGSTDASSFAGSLNSSGNLKLSAQRIYPLSAVNFTINTQGDVTFAAPAGSSTQIPLAAGGSINVVAQTVTQGGNLFAPLGQITLGQTGTTRSVTLAPGSLTSVSLADTVVPFGATLDSKGWYYNLSTATLTAPSEKGLKLAGDVIAVTRGSTIDVSGGGDLQAAEWVQGKGGSRDTLTTTPLGQIVYALVPSSSAAVAAYDIHFATARSLDNGKTALAGDTTPLAGAQITVDGGNGIPAGTYTLYPAHYATLPGAYRVVSYGSNLGRNIASGTALPDGTVLVTGNTTQSTAPGKLSSGQDLFAVQTNTVWRKYSEYQFSRANSYFTQQATKNNIAVPPPLPMDAGRLQVWAQTNIDLSGLALAAPGRDDNGNVGRGSELDISTSQAIAVVGHGQYAGGDAPAGYLALDASQLNAFGFESLLIGGQRSSTTGGTLITATASKVLVDTHGDMFSTPEIILVATPSAGAYQSLTVTPDTGANIQVRETTLSQDMTSGEVTVGAGSVIQATGMVHPGAGRNFYFGSPAGNVTAQDVAAALGGTLDASGTAITGVDLGQLGYVVKNAAGDTVATNPSTLSASALATLNQYRAQAGALFVASGDSSLSIKTGPSATPLSVQFVTSKGGNVVGTVSGAATAVADLGRVILAPGANITAKALTMQGSASKQAIVINTADLHLGQLNLVGRTVAIGSPTPVTDRSIALYNYQFADVGALALKSLSREITVFGDFNSGQSIIDLSLDAGALVRADGTGDATISSRGTLTLSNSGAASTTPAAAINAGTLGLNAKTLVLAGGGTQNQIGYSAVNISTLDRVIITGPGTLDLGAANLTVGTTGILVNAATGANSKSYAITTAGAVDITNSFTRDGIADRPADSAETGGSLALTGSSITVGSTIQAQGGSIALTATAGDVVLKPRAYLAAGGYGSQIRDVTTYIAGGKVALTANAGNVVSDTLSVIDVAQPAGGLGYGGEIKVTALNGQAALSGLLRGEGGPGHGGSFKLDTKGAVDLTALADQLLTGSVTGAIDIHTRTANLELAQYHTLKANKVALTADDPTWDPSAGRQFGQIIVRGTIDARGYDGETTDGIGQAGGQVGLFAANSVLLASTGKIDASTSHADERGGDVVVGIAWDAKSKIYLQTFTEVNVSGGIKGGLSGGTVTFRAPRDGNGDMKIAQLYAGSDIETPAIGGTIDGRNSLIIKGARATSFDAYVAIDTGSSNQGLNGASMGWDGIMDPAGWFDPTGKPAVSGRWINVTGWDASAATYTIRTGFTSLPTSATIIDSTGQGTGATLTNFMMGVYNFLPVATSGFPPNANLTMTFQPPAGANGVAGTATVSTDASGVLIPSSFKLISPGQGYTAPPAYAMVNGVQVLPGKFFGNVVSTLQVVSAQISGTAKGYSITSNLTGTISGGGGTATVTFKLRNNFFSGRSLADGTFVPDTAYIPVVESGVFGFDPTKQNTAGVASFSGDGPHRTFFESTLTQITQGTWTFNGKDYGFSGLFNRLQPLVGQFGSGVVHVQPGVELVNSSAAINGGDITVKTNLNLASGTVIDPATGKAPTVFDPSSSYVNFNYRLATPSWGNVEAGDLTMRTAGNINVAASISDGFFQFGNYLDPTYVANVRSYLPDAAADRSGNGRTLDRTADFGFFTYYLNTYDPNNLKSVLNAPYQNAGNVISPSSADLAVSDVFPRAMRVCLTGCGTGAPIVTTVTTPASWSYTMTAGAELASASRTARVQLSDSTTKGDVVVSGHSTYSQPLVRDTDSYLATAQSSVSVNLTTMLRTGTGAITVAAARDVIMADTVAPGVIYTAGVNTTLPDAGYSIQTINGVSRIVAVNADGFYEPRVLGYGNYAAYRGITAYFGPPTAAAFPESGGDVAIDAQRDIKGNVSTANKAPQYYSSWLLSDSELPQATTDALGQGVFVPSATKIASQTAWWIQYGSFQQGFLSAGGNVTAKAGRDMVDVSISLPTTGRVSGGLSSASTPVTHLYGSGNMVVRSGRDILGGSFYEGSGHASILADGNVGKNENGAVLRFAESALPREDVPLLAVDTGQIAMAAGGSLSMAGVINPASLHAQNPSRFNPFETGANLNSPLRMDTYGQDSKVALVAERGDLTISIAPTTITDKSKANFTINDAPSLYPASFEAAALNGNLVTTGLDLPRDPKTNATLGSVNSPGIVLSPSEHGTFSLLARGGIDLTFGYRTADLAPTANNPPFLPVFSAGSALLETAFDPFQPNSGFNGSSSRALLAHADDVELGIDATARIYATTGDIKAVGGFKLGVVGNGAVRDYQRIQINRPASIYAGRDIVDLNIIIQNIKPSDVSVIQAGRNITYTGTSNAGALQIAGPGYLVVQAGGDIGPFLPLAYDNAVAAPVQEGIASVGIASPRVVGDIYYSKYSVGIYNQTLFGPFDRPRRNTQLTEVAGTREGASINVLFGTKFGVDYDAVLRTYVDPANAASVDHNYMPELRAFMTKVGEGANGDDMSVLAALKTLPADLQHVFVQQVFFAELKAVALANQDSKSQQNQRGYKMVETMFPAALGYTENALTGASGASTLVKTGDLDVLHSTIQTRFGGDISIFGPGGTITVGSLAQETNPILRLRDLGIMTLGGGAINTFTDQSVLVNSSRVLTTQGGDVFMWSSNGNLDAGRGSKTIVSAPAIQLVYDQNAFPSIDPGGYVTGSGIGTLQASESAAPSSLYLLAPRGVIDFGTAGVRSSGNAVIVAPVIANASNFQVSGSTTGIPTVTVPNIAAQTSAGNTGAAAGKSAEPATATGAREQASVFLVEVVGYGGGAPEGATPPASSPRESKKNERDDGSKKEP